MRYVFFFVNDIFTAIKLFQSAIIRWIKICISLLLGFWFMFFFFLDGRYVCDILESHCSFTIFTQFNWFIGKKEYVQKKQVTRIEEKNIYNRQTSIDITYHGRWHSLGKDFRRYRRVEARFWSRDFREMQETEITDQVQRFWEFSNTERKFRRLRTSAKHRSWRYWRACRLQCTSGGT